MLHNRDSGSWKKMAYIGFSFINFGFLLSHVVASVVCAMKLLPNDLEKSLYAIYQFFCWFPLVYMFLVGLHSRRDITALIAELTKIVNESKYTRSTFLKLILFISSYKCLFTLQKTVHGLWYGIWSCTIFCRNAKIRVRIPCNI